MELDNLRLKIDEIDANIVELIAKRIEIVKKIGVFKKQNNMNVVDKKRFEVVLKKVGNLANANGIEKDLIEGIYKKMHEYMCKIEENVNK